MNPPVTAVGAAPETSPTRSPANPATGIEVNGELLLLPDGRLLAHHLTPELAALLQAAFATDLPVH